MLKFSHIRLVIGLMLILTGIMSFLQVSGIMTFDEKIVGLATAVIFTLVGVFFLALLFAGEQNWWAVFPGAGLLAIGALIALSLLLPQFAWLGGSLFLGFLGLAFGWVYTSNHNRWWAIIPGGVLLTLAAVSLGDRLPFLDGGSLFFLGLAATFGLVYLLPTGAGRMSWAWIPAVVMLAMAVFIGLTSQHAMNYLWPVILIALGLFLAYRSFNHKQ